jgi:hypothetical protein
LFTEEHSILGKDYEMKVLYFQAQTTQPEKMLDALRKIDPNCPIPQALEGGDGNGGLWQCILDIGKNKALLSYATHINPRFTVYDTFIHTTEIEDTLYRPDYFVQWRFGDAPTVSPVSHTE